MNVFLSPGRIGWTLFWTATLLAVQSVAAEYILEVMRPEGELFQSFLDLLSVNAEGTIPTWFSSLLIFLGAVLLTVIAVVMQQRAEPDRGYWWGLAAIFFYLSADEGAAIHEIFSGPLQERFQTSGYLEFAWLLLFVPLTVGFVLLYSRFLWRLPPRFRSLFLAAGALFIGGAVFVEAVSANRWSLDGGVTFPYLAIATVEEWLEMVGMSLFVFALLSYMEANRVGVDLGFIGRKEPVGSRRIWLWVVVGAVALNVAIFGWAAGQLPEAVVLDDVLFYRAMAERYEGQGVVILGIEGGMGNSNPAAGGQAEALLTLFDDVLVVDLPGSQLAIAFAAGKLPFDEGVLEEQLQVSGETDYVILDRGALQALVGE